MSDDELWNIYGEILGRGSGKGEDLEEILNVLSFRNSKKISVVKVGGGG